MKKLFKTIIIVITVIIALFMGIYFFLPGAVISAGNQVARCRAGLELKKVTVGDYSWKYLEGGKGNTVLMLHGFGMFKDFWGDLPASLTKNYHVIVPDLPGFGENSRILSDNYSISSQVRRVKEFAEKIGLKNFTLIGFSMGGGIAAYYAGEYPDMVKKLILIDALGIDTPVVSDFEAMVFKGEKPLIYKDVEQYNKVLSLGFFTPPEIPMHFKKYIALKGAENYSFHGKIFDELKVEGNVMEKRLAKIKAKTLILWGEKDRVLDVSIADAFRKGIKDSEVVIIPGAGHMVYLEKPDGSIKAVIDFLASK